MYKPNQYSNPFARTGGSKEFKPKPADHLVSVLSYDVANHIMVGTNQMGKVAAYKIEFAAYERCEKSSRNYQGGAKFMGHRIDGKMAAELPAGTKVMVERATYTSKAKHVDGSPINMYEATRIIASTAQESEKLYCGLFSAVRKEQRVLSVQSWQDKAFSAKDGESIKAFAAQLDADFQAQEAGERIVFRGFQLRALKKVGEEYVCFDSTMPYDFIPGEKSESGEVIRKMTPLSKSKFIEICKDYQRYLLESYPTFKEEGGTLDVLTYKSFLASELSKDMNLGSEYSALSKLTNRKSRASFDDEGGYTGKNVAVRGIIALTEDKQIIENKQLRFETRNLVQKLLANNYQGDVREMVLAFDGAKVKLDESIKVVVEFKNNLPAEIADAVKLEALQAQVMAEAPQAEAEVDLWGDANPFDDWGTGTGSASI